MNTPIKLRHQRTVLITGALGGIGQAVARRFAAEGANLVLVDLRSDADPSLLETLRACGAADLLVLTCDVSDEVAVDAVIATVIERYGSLDVVVNVAGAMLFKRLDAFTGQEWQRLLGINLLGPVYFTRGLLRHGGPEACVVNIASVHARMTTAMVAPYAAAKAAMLSLTRSTAIEGREHGIRANAIIPGAIDTEMLWSNPNLRSGAEVIAPGDIGRPEDVAAAVAFLASADARFITGTTLEVSGGRLSHL